MLSKMVANGICIGFRRRALQARCTYCLSLPSVANDDPSVPPSEPKNLSHLAYYQIERLKDLSNTWIATPNMDLSIQAVIQAYRAGTLDADPTLISYWLNGQMVHRPSADKVEDLAAKSREWTEKYGPGQIHIEQVVVDLPIQQAAVAMYEADPDPNKDKNKIKLPGLSPRSTMYVNSIHCSHNVSGALQKLVLGRNNYARYATGRSEKDASEAIR